MEITEMKQMVSEVAHSLYQRGFVVGSAGNLSVVLDDGTFLATPTGSSFGSLKQEDVSHFTKEGTLLSGKAPTKEVPFHLACYASHPQTKAVVHLHCTYATLLASCEGLKDGEPFVPFTPYFVMKVSKVGILPYRKPGSPLIASDILAKPQYFTYLMQNHGLIVCGPTLQEAMFNAEEFEESAKLWYLGRNLPIRPLTEEQMSELRG
ncbi:class II aldolase/adducin family protein [Sphaerochaeta globosa]|uniref:Class II aldolase/adducin family protein n=1 Tax=Sphaerochaeta globosa (strain ATCC BAA-1886 / DSM 22777 / Buddy) TaxID=158189 RepID=F0RUD1_SPHGB|nr:class II aldolase/adducin family protein [Sphaerochaeta globosa]ADY12293.1 class II aldolase/adducin family protein [Sphaerochaeta globosa str. Buddy]